MGELRRSLQAGDPLRHEPTLEPADVDAMRRAVLAAARPSPRGSHAIMIAIATSLAALVVAGAWIVRSTPPAAPALPRRSASV